MTDQATLAARLAEAETAYHQLMTGRRVVRLRHGEMENEFNKSNISDLRAYISELKVQLGLSGGARRARRVVFG